MPKPSIPPYIPRLLERLSSDDPLIKAAFGKHIHWGCFEDPSQTRVTADDFARAAEALCHRLLRLAKIIDGQRVLDIGCGIGGAISCVNQEYSDVEIIGLNIDPHQIQQATVWVRPERRNRISFVVADANTLPFPDEFIDRAICVESVFHFDRPRFFAEVSRVLRPGGSLTLSDFVPEERAASFIAGAGVVEDKAVQSAYGSIDISWPLSRYERLAESCALSLTSSEDISQHTLPTYEFLRSCVEADYDDEAGHFRRATDALSKATRRGYVTYQILRFVKMRA